ALLSLRPLAPPAHPLLVHPASLLRGPLSWGLTTVPRGLRRGRLRITPPAPSGGQHHSYKYHDRSQTEEGKGILNARFHLVERGGGTHRSRRDERARGGRLPVDRDGHPADRLASVDCPTDLIGRVHHGGHALSLSHVHRQRPARDQRQVVAAVVEIRGCDLLALAHLLHRVVE